MKVKYFGVYCGPSYFSYSTEIMDGFESLADARQSMRNRQAGRDYVNEYRENDNGSFVPWSTNRLTDFPASTSTDYLDLHEAVPNGDGTYLVLQEISYRISIGERGGIVTERG